MGGGTTGGSGGWAWSGLALAWLAGVGLQLRERALSPPGGYVGVLVAGVCVLLVAAAIAGRARGAAMRALMLVRVLLMLLGATAAGFGHAGWRAADRMAETLPAALEGEDLDVVGVVAALPQRGPSGLRFRFEVEQARWRGVAVVVPPLVAVAWGAGYDDDAALLPAQRQLGAGQRWRFVLRLRQPHGNLNPHGFDYELRCSSRACGPPATCATPRRELLDAAAGHPVERLRQRVRDAIDAAVPTARRRRARGAVGRRPVGDRARGLGPVPQHRHRPPDVDQRPARHDVRVARRRVDRRAVAAQRAGDALAAGAAGGALGRLAAPRLRVVLGLGRAVAAHGLDARDGDAAAGARQALAWRWCCSRRSRPVTLLDPWALLQAGFWMSFLAAVGLADGPSMRRAARRRCTHGAAC
jgi:competence protein ComEC